MGHYGHGARDTRPCSRTHALYFRPIVGNAEWNTGPDYDGLLNGVMMEQFLQGEAEAQKFCWTAVVRTLTMVPRTGVIVVRIE